MTANHSRSGTAGPQDSSDQFVTPAALEARLNKLVSTPIAGAQSGDDLSSVPPPEPSPNVAHVSIPPSYTNSLASSTAHIHLGVQPPPMIPTVPSTPVNIVGGTPVPLPPLAIPATTWGGDVPLSPSRSASARVSFRDEAEEVFPLATILSSADVTAALPDRSLTESPDRIGLSLPSEPPIRPILSPFDQDAITPNPVEPVPASAFDLELDPTAPRRMVERDRERNRRSSSYSSPQSPKSPAARWTGSHSTGAARPESDANAIEPAHLSNRSRSRSFTGNGVASPAGGDYVPQSGAGTPTLRKRLSMYNRRSEKEVLVGTPVKEGHVNYMLMYDMLTGIRISGSRNNAKPPRDIEDADYLAAHKLAFDVTGNEMTPKSKYDFKFKDYAPWVFRYLREAFHVDSNEYLYVLSELGSPGKSGSFFYYSSDYRFIIKTIHHSEKRFILSILKNYYEHVKANPQTLLSRILGLHRVKLPRNRKIHFVVMGNVFPPNKDIHEIYDLKGSTVGRELPEEEARDNPRAVMKDLNWLKREKTIELGPEKREVYISQMEKDVA
ncbi:hypothetical protein BDK51DRAFT_46799, partial [Blyttiomyces helicus]